MLDPTPSSPSSSLGLSRKLGCVITPLHWQSPETPHPVTERKISVTGPGPKPQATRPFHAGCVSVNLSCMQGNSFQPPCKIFSRYSAIPLPTFTSAAWFWTSCSKQPSPTPTRRSAVGSGSFAGDHAQPCSPTSGPLNPSPGLRGPSAHGILHCPWAPVLMPLINWVSKTQFALGLWRSNGVSDMPDTCEHSAVGGN